MGIHDRDWQRQSGPVRRRGGGAQGSAQALQRMRGFNATTWIVIICAFVFIIDGFGKPVSTAQFLKPSNWTLTNLEYEGPIDSIRYQPPLDQPPANITPVGEGNKSFLANCTIYRAGDDGAQIKIGFAEYQNFSPLKRYGFFSTATALFGTNSKGGIQGGELWRFISFQFLHANFWHIFMNMFALWIFGPLVERYLGKKRFVAFYLLCGIFGALLYLILNAASSLTTSMGMENVPFLLQNTPHTPLIGASAGVFGVLLAGAFLSPNSTVLLAFFIPIRLVTLAYGLVVAAIVMLFFQTANAGGEAAHLGGAIAGFYFIRNPHHLHGFFDFIGRADPTSRSSQARKLRSGKAVCAVADSEIDRILAKIHDNGLHSLTAKEKKTLREASKR